MPSLNIASRLVEMSRTYPNTLAVAEPLKRRFFGPTCDYRTRTFQELNDDSDRIAAGLVAGGVVRGMKIAIFVRYGIDFIATVYAMCKTGATLVLIDPGMGIKRMLDCLAEVAPDGFIAVPPVHAARILAGRRFARAKHNITVGRRWFWGGPTLDTLRTGPLQSDFTSVPTSSDDLAAIIFTSGSTGPPKGVAFTHGIFDTQVDQIAKQYDIRPGEIDLACFPFFGLFDAAMGVTAIIPEMDTTRPASANPARIVESIDRWKITQSFASPALWNRVADYCLKTGNRMSTLQRAVSAGAPVSASILEQLKRCIAPDGDIYTPYGATEALPTATIAASEVLAETAARTRQGEGVCVGRRFSGIAWKVIEITDSPIKRLEDARELPCGQIGELAVTGPQVTKEYVNRPQANTAAKMIDTEERTWHRMGDVGYLDEQDRFWFCGRKAHRVALDVNGTDNNSPETATGPETLSRTLFSIPCESIFNQHPKIFRSALAAAPNETGPRMFVEPFPKHYPKTPADRAKLIEELKKLGQEHPLTRPIREIRILRHFPVDVRHNVKINREFLATLK